MKVKTKSKEAINRVSTEGKKLPDGWKIKDIGSICNIQRGLTYSRKDTVDISEKIVLRATNIDLN